jgi:hypothetical protein
MNIRDLLAITAALFLTACSGLSASGYAPTLYTSIHAPAFASLKPGVSTKEDVRKGVGVPLTESHFPRLNEDVWEFRCERRAQVLRPAARSGLPRRRIEIGQLLCALKLPSRRSR